MSNNWNNNIRLFCSHTKKPKEYTINNIIYSYCEECGNIAIKNNNNFYYTIKPKQKQRAIEVNPITITKNMKKNQELAYPNLYNIYNLDIKENISKIKERIMIYFNRRKIILLYLQAITRKLNYSDLTFYHCLLLVDLYFTHNITEEMADEELLYVLIGFFMISSKFKETDIYEPELCIFNNIDANFIISFEKILLYETICLKFINYNFFIYSAYDWLNIFISNGYIFEGEINNKDYIHEIHIHTYRLLIIITPKNIFIKYSSFYIAISIIQIAREDKIDENKVNNELFEKLLNLYDIKFEDYEDCYREIKAVINLENNMNNNINKFDNSNINTSRNQSPISKKIENNKNINQSSERINTFSNIENISNNNNINTQSKSNLKKKLKEAKINKQYINLIGPGKTRKQFHSIIVNNNINNNKNHNLNIYKKNLEILEYINSNLPNIYNNGIESNKVLKTEGETISGMNFQIGKFKNIALNNISYTKKIIKSKLPNSLDNKNLKKIDINKKKMKISPLKLGNFIRNGTNDSLEKNNKDYSKFLYKNSTNVFHTENNSLILNNSGGGDNLKYYNNVSNNIINNNNKKEELLIVKNYLVKNKNNNNININNINTYKNFSNIYKNNIKPLFRESTADNIGNNNIIINIRRENPFSFSKTKDVGEHFKKRNDIIKIESLDKISSSLDKNKENKINILTSRNSNKKSFLNNLKFDKDSFNNPKDLFLKKQNYNNSKLPKLKLKIDK